LESLDLVTILTVAFFGSIGHCSGMCGGFVVAYSTAKLGSVKGMIGLLFRHLLYNFGRVFSYVMIGGLFGFLGSMIAFSNEARGGLYFFVAILMILIGYSLMGKSRFLYTLEGYVPFNSALKAQFSKVIKSTSLGSFWMLGVLNGLLPCGFVYFFAISAAATASVMDGAMVMGVFGVATIPVLLAIGFTASFIQKHNLRKMAQVVAGWVIMVYGIWYLYRGYLFVFTQGPACH
jgi:uncharacterized protein